MIKVIDRLFIRGFIGPILLSFFIVEFVLVMQTLWKSIDDILGNGYSAIDYIDLIGNFSIALIPLALPLTILLSSVMVFGDMAEKYEILCLKSAGVSFGRMLLPGIAVATMIAFFSFYASNELRPAANARYMSKLRAMKTNKLTFVFDEKIFNKEFNNYSIYIDEKQPDGRTVKGILISDYTDPDKSLVNVTYAKSAEMFVTADQKYLIMNLDSGYQFSELRSETSDKQMHNYDIPARPVRRVEFSKLYKTFDLSQLLDLSRISMSYQEYEFMNCVQLSSRIDSLRAMNEDTRRSNIREFQILSSSEDTDSIQRVSDSIASLNVIEASQTLAHPNVSTKRVIAPDIGVKIDFDRSSDPEVKSILQLIETKDTKDILDPLKSNIRAINDNVDTKRSDIKGMMSEIGKYQIRFHQQFSWALVCLVFLFIGAPAGIIVRKGGFGAPMLIATGFYILFIMLYISGERLLRSGALTAIYAAWLPTFVLMPFALVLSFRAFKDTKLFDFSMSRILLRWKKKLNVNRV